MPGGMPFSQPSSVGDTRGDGGEVTDGARDDDGVDVGSGAVESSRDGVDHKT